MTERLGILMDPDPTRERRIRRIEILQSARRAVVRELEQIDQRIALERERLNA